MTENVRIFLTFLQDFLEGFFREQSDVFREHRKQAAHQEHRDVLRRIVLLLKRERDLREALGDIPRDLRRFLGGIEGCRIEPDFAEAFADFLVAQVFEVDAEGLSIRELCIVLSLSGKISIDLDTMANPPHSRAAGWRPLVIW